MSYAQDKVIFERKFTVASIEEYSEYGGEERRTFSDTELDELSEEIEDAVFEVIIKFLNSHS